MAYPTFTPEMLPKFSNIVPQQIEPQLLQILNSNRQKLQQILSAETYTWDNLMQPLENMDELSKFWSPISHLHSVMETEELRNAYNQVLPILTEYHTEISQNETLYAAISSLATSQEYAQLHPAQRKIIENDLRDFKLAGIHLPPEKKARMAELQQQLSQLMTKFSEHILDATHAWFLHLTREEDMRGLPEQALQLAKENAAKRDLEGFVLTLDFPSYSTALKFLDARDIREELYKAYVTRASEVGPHGGKYDNTHIMEEILKVRHEVAELVGFKNYAEYSLATKMAKTSHEVLRFLYDLLERSKPIAHEELKEIKEIAKRLDNLDEISAWDISYYSEKLREAKFNFSPEDLRPYFPIQHVLEGMFIIVNKIYGLTIKLEPNVEVWHPDVHFFSIYDEQNMLRGGFYIDLYARPHKRDGAWMDDARMRRVANGKVIQYPIAYLTCNFMPPVENKPALLTHDDVLTLFHEFGHCLHHMLTKVDYASVAGINGVPWDAVEFPSQFMENFCWDKASLSLLAVHYETGQQLPDELYTKMIAAKHFQTGLQMVRQIEFSIFDFKLHLEYEVSDQRHVQTMIDKVRKETSVFAVPEFNRFQHSFSHIFAGAYAAGYYSYKWAEVLSCDAYEQFEENGIFDRRTGRSFMENILEVGGARDPMVSFMSFRGREPKIDALLRQNGMVKTMSS